MGDKSNITKVLAYTIPITQAAKRTTNELDFKLNTFVHQRALSTEWKVHEMRENICKQTDITQIRYKKKSAPWEVHTICNKNHANLPSESEKVLSTCRCSLTIPHELPNYWVYFWRCARVAMAWQKSIEKYTGFRNCHQFNMVESRMGIEAPQMRLKVGAMSGN